MPVKPILDVMLDLETLGTAPGCVVLSIGAVYFDARGLHDEFYRVINTSSCIGHGLIEDPQTVAWWAQQNPKAREVLEKAEKSTKKLSYVLGKLSQFLDRYGAAANIRLWGCGAAFDNAILAATYKACGLEPPWKFWNDRCYRTLKALADPAIKVERTGIHHNALADAKTQALHASRILAAAGRWT